MVKIDEQNPNAEVEIVNQVFGPTGIARDVVYTKGRMLGKGGFARVYELTERSTGRICACKVIPHASLVKPRQRRKLQNEIAIQQALNHRNIVRLLGFFSDVDNTYLLIELCNHRTVLDMLKHRGRLPEREVRYWLAQTISAMAHMHSQLVIHRDLKLGNMFIHDMQLKIGDFGLAAKLDNPQDRKRTICGTPNYIAPEILESPCGHSFEADIWSLGVVAYTLLVGYPPFETKDVQKTYTLIKANAYSFPRDRPVTVEARDFVRSILRTVPGERLRLDKMLAHPFFAEPVPVSLPIHALRTEPAIPALSPSKARLRYEHVPPSPSHPPKSVVAAATAATTAAGAMDEPENNPNNQVQRLPNSPPHPVPAKRQRPAEAARLAPAPAVGAAPAAAPPPPHAGVPFAAPLTVDRLCLIKESLEVGELIAAVEHAREEWPMTQATDYALVGHLCEARNFPAVFIRKWADLSERYGLGFLLSTGSVCAFFNDATKMLMTPACTEIGFVPQSNTELTSFATTIEKSALTHDLAKKTTLVKYFRDLFFPGTKMVPRHAGSAAETRIGEVPCFVAHYYKTSLAMIFRFSTGQLQVNFNDHVKIVVKPGWKDPVRFIDVNVPGATLEEATEMPHAKPENPDKYLVYTLHFLHKLQERCKMKRRESKEAAITRAAAAMTAAAGSARATSSSSKQPQQPRLAFH